MLARQILAAVALCAAAAAQADAPQLRATRAAGRIAIDGQLDEADWSRAEPFAGFVQVFPGEGVPPSEATEVRVLFDETAIYVGIRCHDGRPLEIVRPFGRRDSPPASDAVTVLLETSRDRRSAVLFSLTAGGVQSDALVYDDDRITYEWDAPWEGAVQVTDDGWTAELAIPLSVARYDPAARPTLGFGVIRDVARSHEKDATFLMPRSASGMVTRLGTLGGLDAAARSGVDVTAYTAQRLTVRPKLSDPASPRPRLADASGDVGVDLHANVGRLALTATANPDFGQVEADEVILNLSSFEPFFPEKRPFFTEGADAFASVGAGRERVPQQLFYSRRIGLDAPILGAAKLVGDAGDGLRIGVLDALVMGPGQAPGASEDAPDRRMAWSASRPFHVGPADANPLVAPTTQNFLAGVVRQRVSDGLTVGAQAASALLVGPQCTDEVLQRARRSDGIRPSSCDAQGGNALALDFNAASRDSVWYAYGQATGSRVEGGPPERTLRDGTVLRQGDLGAGAYVRAGKRGGEGFRFDLAWTYAAPRLDLNSAGFQRTQNQQEVGVTLRYARTDVRPFHEFTAVGGGYGQWTTDGRGIARGRGAAIGFDAQLKDPYLWASCRLRYTDPMYDVREVLRPDEDGNLEGTGIPFRRPPTQEATCDVSTDAARPFSADLGGYIGRNVQMGPLGAPGYHGVNAGVTLHPHPRLETRLVGAYDRSAYPARFLERVGSAGDLGEQFLFGALTAPALSLTLRQLVVLTPRLTFQLYGQLFAAYESWGALYTATSRGGAIEPSALRRASLAEGFDSHTSALVVNAVLRWEYRTGSTLYLVYARNQTELPIGDGRAVPHALTPAGLALGPTTDSFLVKWSYRFAR